MREFETLQLGKRTKNIGLNPDTIVVKRMPTLFKTSMLYSGSLVYGKVTKVQKKTYHEGKDNIFKYEEKSGIAFIVSKESWKKALWDISKSRFYFKKYNYRSEVVNEFQMSGQAWQMFKNIKTRSEAIIIAKMLLLQLPNNVE